MSDMFDDLENNGPTSDAQWIALAINRLATATNGVARQIRNLGNGDAATHMGGLEALGLVIKESTETLASAISRDE